MNDIGATAEIYCGVITQYMNRYIWEIEDRLPKSDAELWNMFRGHAAKYFRAVELRYAAFTQ